MTKISRKLKHLAMLPLFALFSFIGAVTVQAATYYVATTGNDAVTCANSANSSTPRKTIRQGMSCMAAGDTLYIRAGTYAESINSVSQTIPTGTSYANAPLISAHPGETVILTSGGDIINLAASYIQYVEFANLVLDGGNQSVSVGGAGATAHHVKFTNIESKNAFHQGFQISATAHHVWVTGGKVHDAALNDTAVPTGYPFYISGDDHLVENVEIYNSNHNCVQVYHSHTPPNRVILRNNILHHCGLTQASSGAILVQGNDHLVYNNIAYSNSCHGIMTQIAANAKFYNNTVYGGAQTGIYVYPGSTNTEVRNNITYGNSSTPILDQGTGTTIDHNLTTNPFFVNAAAINFNLQTNSPAIDAGTRLSVVTTDIKMIPRPQGATYDIGAHEVSTGTADLPPTSPVGLRVN